LHADAAKGESVALNSTACREQKPSADKVRESSKEHAGKERGQKPSKEGLSRSKSRGKLQKAATKEMSNLLAQESSNSRAPSREVIARETARGAAAAADPSVSAALAGQVSHELSREERGAATNAASTAATLSVCRGPSRKSSIDSLQLQGMAVLAEPLSKDGTGVEPVVDTTCHIVLRPLPYDRGSENNVRRFVYKGELIEVPLLPLQRLEKDGQGSKDRRSNHGWQMVKSKVIGAAAAGQLKTIKTDQGLA